MDRLYLIYDIFPVLIILLCVINGSRRGFLRTVLGLAVYIAAVIGAGIFSGRLPEPVYMTAFRPRIVAAVESGLESSSERINRKLEDTLNDIAGEEAEEYAEEYSDISWYLTNPDFSDKLNSAAEYAFSAAADALAETLPGFIAKSLEAAGTDDKAAVISDIIAGEYLSAAESIEEAVIRPAALRMIGYAVWSISFTVILAAGKIAVGIVLKIRKIDSVRSADKLLGGALGFVKSAVMITASVIIIKLIIGLTPESGFFSSENVDRTLIFRHIYNLINI